MFVSIVFVLTFRVTGDFRRQEQTDLYESQQPVIGDAVESATNLGIRELFIIAHKYDSTSFEQHYAKQCSRLFDG